MLSTDTHAPISEEQAPPIPGPQHDSDPDSQAPHPHPPSHSLVSPIELCQKMRNFFYRAQKNKTRTRTVFLKNGGVEEIEEREALPPPQFSEFLRSIPMSIKEFSTLYDSNEEVREAFEDCKMVYREFIVENGLLGLYDSNFAKYIANVDLKMIPSMGTFIVTHQIANQSDEESNNKRKKIKNKLNLLETTNRMITEE